MDFDFDTSGQRRSTHHRNLFGRDEASKRPGPGDTSETDRSLAAWWLWLWGGNPNSGPSLDERSARGDYVILGGSRKAVLVHLAVAVWKAGYVPKDVLSQVRGHALDPETDGAENKLVRALTRSSMGVRSSKS